jgi:hypothetical protein
MVTCGAGEGLARLLGEGGLISESEAASKIIRLFLILLFGDVTFCPVNNFSSMDWGK